MQVSKKVLPIEHIIFTCSEYRPTPTLYVLRGYVVRLVRRNETDMGRDDDADGR
jgi:hypothetical protein